MKITFSWKEENYYRSTVEIDDAKVWDYARELVGSGVWPKLPEQISDELVEAYLDSDNDTWFEQVNSDEDYSGTRGREVEAVESFTTD